MTPAMKPKPPTIHEVEARNVSDSTALTIETAPQKRTRWEKRLVETWGRGDRGVWDQSLGICKGCGSAIDTTPTPMRFADSEVFIPSSVCEPCMELVREHYDPAAAARLEDPTETPKWDQNCPQRYRDVVLGIARPARVDWVAIEKVRAWRPTESKGLVLVGTPGVGKTCAFWWLARDLERAGHQPITIGSLELARVLSEAARDIKEVGWLYRCRVLMVDDLGKERATPAAAALLWEVLDRRLSANLPVILTTNFDGPGLARRFGEDHLGDSIRRRIGDLCRVVRFAGEETTQTAAAA